MPADLKKIAAEIVAVFNSPAYQKEAFGPIKIVEANTEVFIAGNNTATKTIRQFQLNKRFKNDDSLFKWLIPEVNKIFLADYLYAGSYFQHSYDTLFSKMIKGYCPCVGMAARSKDVLADNNLLKCMEGYLKDTAFIKEYRNAFFLIPEEHRKDFFEVLLAYFNINCNEAFNKLIVLAQEEVPKFYEQSLIYYKGAFLESVAKYSLLPKKDSLLIIFPTYAQYAKEIASLQKLYKQSDTKLVYTIQELVSNNQLERKSAWVADKDTSKIHLLGQFVFEVGLDKPIIYLRTLKFYPREAIQSIDWIEKEMEKAKHQHH